MLHRRNCPGIAECEAWQKGVQDFAGWLDHIGVNVMVVDYTEDFYDYVRANK